MNSCAPSGPLPWRSASEEPSEQWNQMGRGLKFLKREVEEDLSPFQIDHPGHFITAMRNWLTDSFWTFIIYSTCVTSHRQPGANSLLVKNENSPSAVTAWDCENDRQSESGSTVSSQRIVGGRQPAACGNMRVASCSHSVRMDVPVNYAVITTHRQNKYQRCCSGRPHRKPVLP